MDLEGYTACGPREANEDNYFVSEFSSYNSFTNDVCALAVVSDGMGGYLGGDRASSIVVEESERYLNKLLEMAHENQIELDARAALDEIVQNAHAAIKEEAESNNGRSMGATFVGAFISPTHAWIGHVGDSRAYLIRAGEAIQLTEDHSQVGRMLRRGLISEEEAQNHPDRNKIEQALGFTVQETEIDEVDLEAGDALLLCSDGVYTVLTCEKLAASIEGAADAAQAAAHAVQAALASTDDNSTALVIFPDRDHPARKRGADTIVPGMAVAQNTLDMPTEILNGTNPTQAMPSVAASSHPATHNPERRALSSSSTSANAASAKAGGRNKPLKGLLIPILVGAGLLLLLGGLLLSTWNQGGGGSGAAGNAGAGGAVQQESTSSENQPLANPDVEPSEAKNSSSSSMPAEHPSTTGSGKTATLGTDGAVLKYADSNDHAHKFSELTYSGDTGSDPRLKASASVAIDGTVSDFGISGNRYQPLALNYIDEFKSDFNRYTSTPTGNSISFDSKISKLFTDKADYLNFLGLVAELIENDTLELSDIARFIIDNDAISNGNAGSFTSSSSNTTTNTSESNEDDEEESLQTYTQQNTTAPYTSEETEEDGVSDSYDFTATSQYEEEVVEEESTPLASPFSSPSANTPNYLGNE